MIDMQLRGDTVTQRKTGKKLATGVTEVIRLQQNGRSPMYHELHYAK